MAEFNRGGGGGFPPPPPILRLKLEIHIFFNFSRIFQRDFSVNFRDLGGGGKKTPPFPC